VNERDELHATLAWSGLPQVGEQTLLALLDHAREARLSMVQLWQSRAEDLAQLVALHPRALAALREQSVDGWAQAGADLEEALARGVELLQPTQPDFPPVFWQLSGRDARRWPFVFAYGGLGLLEEPRVALVSSRDVSAEGLAITDAIGDALARRDVTLVTSINREGYQAAATAAKRHAGPAVMVLDRGFSAAFPAGLDREPVATARVWDEQFDPELQLLLSPFGWRDVWTARNGKRRDSLIFDLADVVVAIDVRADGHIETECRRAAQRGRTVLVLDRGNATADGVRRLWEDFPSIRRIPWSGGEGVAQAVVDLLAPAAPDAASERAARGWQREVAAFLCRLVTCYGGQPLVLGAYPEQGVLAQAARLWSVRGGDSRAGVGALVADLFSGADVGPARMTQLLARVAPGGLIAALIPAAWVVADQFASPRASWLQEARLRLTLGVPLSQSPGARDRESEAAVVLLQRLPGAPGEALSFAPDRTESGRFQLRRYLREVLTAVALAKSSSQFGA